MTDRCEPPPELRDVAGWHWVLSTADDSTGEPEISFWFPPTQNVINGRGWWEHGEIWDCYIAPVSTPAEVDVLRAERDDALKLQGEVHRLRTGIKLLADTVRAWGWQSKAQESNGELVGRALHDLRARVSELEWALHDINLKDTFSHKSWGPYAEIARAALKARGDAT